MSLKELKEQFVADLTGGSISEIYAVTGSALAALLAHTCIQQWVLPYLSILRKFPISFIVAFYFDVIIQLQAITIYSSKMWDPYYTAGAISVVALVYRAVFVGSTKERKNHKTKNSRQELLGFIPYITAYRAQMIIITNLAILAVDFHVFPRRFAKVETWGTSMMDLGVGSFVFSMGLANSRSVIKKSLVKGKSTESYLKLVHRNTIKALPVLVLGLIRLVSVKSLEYQEHVTEYGVHWNFFMTLGLLPIFLGLVDPLFAVVPRFVVALSIGVIYETCLNSGLAYFVLDESNRSTNLVTMNKEGLASFVGYLSIFVFGQSFGSFVLTTKKTPNNLLGVGLYQNQKKWLTFSSTQGLFISTVVSMTMFWLSDWSLLTGSISRRLANLSYVLWVVSYNSAMLLCYNLSERIVGPISSRLLNAINRNGLAIFLAANLTTGLVNMSMNTLEASDGVAYAMLVVYALFWVVLALVLDYYKIYIKL